MINLDVNFVNLDDENECFGWDLAVAAITDLIAVEVVVLVDVRVLQKVSDANGFDDRNQHQQWEPKIKKISMKRRTFCIVDQKRENDRHLYNHFYRNLPVAYL